MKKSLPKSGRRIGSSALAERRNTRSAPSTANGPLDADLLRKIDSWWRAPGKPRVILTHGEDEPRQVLAQKIQQRFNLKSALPGMGDVIEI